ncbi:hypothetical protein JVT61DRAFT_13548 [Boletus reticuloceps]|uniref:Uncharacterized protein n=1 Tax=Boletus reticuloceps TaxID=495285 RepID=A0A8I2YD42_9AGAM|nr:hypothetical protein JVT61DRAFT_13548 [Boletus reticuloceps]
MSRASAQINTHPPGQINNNTIEHFFFDNDLESSDAGAQVLHVDPLLDNAPADAPFNVAGIPDHMQADNAYAHTVIDEAIMCSTHLDPADADFEAEFRTAALQQVYLVMLKTFFKQKNYCATMSILKQHSLIVINQDFHLSTTDDHVIPSIQGHFVNFVLYLLALVSDSMLPSPPLSSSRITSGLEPKKGYGWPLCQMPFWNSQTPS